MLLISCPWCGARAQDEFVCRGEAHISRPAEPDRLSDAEWAELAIVSDVHAVSGIGDDLAEIALAPGHKCDRCWRVLTEVGTTKAHPTLCLRCTDAVEAA